MIRWLHIFAILHYSNWKRSLLIILFDFQNLRWPEMDEEIIKLTKIKMITRLRTVDCTFSEERISLIICLNAFCINFVFIFTFFQSFHQIFEINGTCIDQFEFLSRVACFALSCIGRWCYNEKQGNFVPIRRNQNRM